MKKIFFILSILIIFGTENVFAQFDFLGVEEESQVVSEEDTINEQSQEEKQLQSEEETIEQIQTEKSEDKISEELSGTEVEQTIPKDDYFTGFIEDVEAEKMARAQAKQMLKDGPKIIKLRQSQIKELEKNKIEREKIRQKFIDREQEKMKPEEKLQNLLETFEAAPLGLNWAISPDEMKQLGFELEEIEREDYPNSYVIKNYSQKVAKGYEIVIVSFGENNELWCINAQTTAQEDDASAKETLKLYDKYFEALAGKYGNANEHFTPFTYEEEISEVKEDEKENKQEIVTRIVKKENPRGNPNFLKELQSGKAELYATFHNNNVGVTLSVYIDKNGTGQLVLDYKNLPMLKKEKEAFINNL